MATLPSTYSVHEFHNYGFQGTGISPGLHFHLSGTINALTDIPLGSIHILRNFWKKDEGHCVLNGVLRGHFLEIKM